MRIIADESVDGRIIDRLRLAGHDVLAIAESAPGTPDDLVLANADTAGVLLCQLTRTSALASHAMELAAVFTVIAPESVGIRRPPHAGA